jgi:hypothetical protein
MEVIAKNLHKIIRHFRTIKPVMYGMRIVFKNIVPIPVYPQKMNYHLTTKWLVIDDLYRCIEPVEAIN